MTNHDEICTNATNTKTMNGYAEQPFMSDRSWIKKIIIFLASQTISLFGSTAIGFAIVWYITLETSSGIMMTIGTLCNFIPQIVISPIAGVWADRYSRKILIILGDACIAGLTLILALFYLSGYTDMWLVFFVLAMRSLFSGIQMPAVSAILPQLVPADKLLRINALNSTINSAMTLLSPAVGGAILGILGFGYSLLVDTVTAALAIVILLFLTVPRLSTNTTTHTPWADLKDGLTYMGASPFLRKLLLFYVIIFFLLTPASFLTPLLVERSFGPEVWKLTANEMSWSLGSVVGGVVISLWGGFKNRIFSLAVATLCFGWCFFFCGLTNQFWLYLVIVALGGFFMPLYSSAEMTLIQEKTTPEMMGRVFSLIHLCIATVMPIGMLLFGPLADLVSVELLLIVTGLLLAILGFYILFNKKLLAFDDKPSSVE